MSYLRQLLGENEQVLFTTHQHWTAFLGRTWHFFLWFLIGCALAVGANLLPGANLAAQDAFQQLTPEQQWGARIGIFVILLFYPTAVLLVRYIRWQSEQYVVTNLRVLQLSGILSKRVLDSSLEKVNDILLEQPLIGRLLNYGHIEILTAAEMAVNKFRRVANPLAFKAAMLNAKQRLDGDGHAVHQDATVLISDLARLKTEGVITEEEFQAKKARLLKEL